MKQQRMIYHADGENAGTYGFLCFAENFKGDLEEKTEKFVSWDCDIYTQVHKYSERTVIVPDWMTENLWKEYHIDYKYIIGLTDIEPDKLSRTWFDKLRRLNESYRYFIGWVLGKKTANPFMTSIREQIINWLDDEQSKYGTPLSPKQWEVATRYCPLYKAKQISTSLYYNR